MKPCPGLRFLGGRKHFWMAMKHPSGRPSTTRTDENVLKVRDLIKSDRRLTVRMIAYKLNLNHQTVQEILTDDFKMRKICAKMVPKNLTQEQKDNRKNVCVDLFGALKVTQIFF